MELTQKMSKFPETFILSNIYIYIMIKFKYSSSSQSSINLKGAIIDLVVIDSFMIQIRAAVKV